MFKKFMLTCDEATTICDKSQYGEASFNEKIKLSFHVFLCKICGKYSKQNKKMTVVFKMKANGCKKEIPCLTTKDKEVFKRELQKAE